MILFGIVGLIIVSYAVWKRNEKRQDILFIIGGVSLLIYSIFIENVIFILLQAIFVASAGVELIKLSKKR